MVNVRLWSSAWILLGLSCNGYMVIKLMYVQFGDCISVCNLQCQFIRVQATKAYGSSGDIAAFVLSLGVGDE